jgi:hypothetical protein
VHPFLLFFLLPSCPRGSPNLAAGKPVASYLVRNDPRVVTDGRFAPEGGPWETPGDSTVLTNPDAFVRVDLGELRRVDTLVLQGDSDDLYPIEGSLDGTVWRLLWEAPVVAGRPGLRSRWFVLPRPAEVRFLRVRASGGDDRYSVSELGAYCGLPEVWPPQPIGPGRSAPMNEGRMVAIKGALALLGALVLCAGMVLRRMRGLGSWLRLFDVLLAGMGIFALLCWFNLGHEELGRDRQLSERYHYYIGAKYFRELRYTRLYQCTAVAEMEQGLTEAVAQRKMRDLGTNLLGGTQTITADPTICTRHFTPERWEAFKADIAFFRSYQTADSWAHWQEAHGYNATPVWGILGGFLANRYPAGQRFHLLGLSPRGVPYIDLLGALDPILLCVLGAAIVWAFGWRTACVAALYFGTNYPARSLWNAGAYLRMDWLAASIIGICLVKRGKMAGGGAALTYGALLRIFPGFIVFGLIGKAVARMIRERRFVVAPEHWAFAKGSLAALVILVPLSAVEGGGRFGLDAWIGNTQDMGFVQNSRKHLQTPLTNNMGLKTVVAFQYQTRASAIGPTMGDDPFQIWKARRRAVFEHRKVLFCFLVGGFMVLLGWAAAEHEDWVALALGVGMIVMAADLTSYYYSFGLAFGLLHSKRAWTGVLTCLLGSVPCLLAATPWWAWDDERYTWLSLAYVLAVVGLTGAMGLQARRRATQAGKSGAFLEATEPSAVVAVAGKG